MFVEYLFLLRERMLTQRIGRVKGRVIKEVTYKSVKDITRFLRTSDNEIYLLLHLSKLVEEHSYSYERRCEYVDQHILTHEWD